MQKYILEQKDTLLLIIDIQDKLLAVMKYKDKVVKNTNVLVEMSKTLEIPIVVTEQYPKGLGPTIKEIKEQIGDSPVFEKNYFSAYIDEVKNELKKQGKKKIIVTGMETHVCVYQTVRDLLLEGYDVFVSKDAVASRTKENYLNGLELIQNMGAVVTNTETIAFDLLKKSGTPEFKEISKLIK